MITAWELLVFVIGVILFIVVLHYGMSFFSTAKGNNKYFKESYLRKSHRVEQEYERWKSWSLREMETLVDSDLDFHKVIIQLKELKYESDINLLKSKAKFLSKYISDNNLDEIQIDKLMDRVDDIF